MNKQDRNLIEDGNRCLLYEIPKKSIIKTKLTSGREVDITFWHLDGAYSYCTLEDSDPDNVIHLSASTPLLKRVGHYIIDKDAPKELSTNL